MLAVTVGSWLVLAVFVITWWPRINTERRWRAAALGLALVFSLVHQLLYSTVVRDAFVTFRYARNLAEGYGPVYNPGEYVEGYSNFLWMALMALPEVAFGGGVVAAAVIVGVACVLGCVLLAYLVTRDIVRFARPHGAGLPAVGVAAAVLTAGASSLAAYGYSGLETALFVLLVLLVCRALVARRAVVAGVLVALATMARPDGVVVAAVAAGWLIVEATRRRVTPLAPLAYLLGALVLLVPWTVWRVTVYEHFVPNVVAAGLGGSMLRRLSEGWDYLAEFALSHQALVLLAVAGVALLLTRRGVAEGVARARSVVWLLLTLAVAFAATSVAVGGGWLPVWRLLAPVPPLLAIAATAAYGLFVVTNPANGVTPREGSPGGVSPEEATSGATRPGTLVRRRTAPVTALAVCGLSLVVTTMHPHALPAMRNLDRVTNQLEEIGAWLGDTLPSGTVVSTHATGALAYWAGPSVVVIDVFGRTDAYIAREGNRAVVGEGLFVVRDYDYVVNVRSPSVAIEETAYTTEQQCGIHPAYAGLYEVASFRRTGTHHWVTLYLRRVLAPQLIERLDADPRFQYVSCL